MRTRRQWAVTAATIITATVLPASAAFAAVPAAGAAAAASSSCSTNTWKDPQKLSSATVTICKAKDGTVLSAVGTVSDLKANDKLCARVDISQLWGDLDEGEYVFTTDYACGGRTTPFSHVGGWVNYDIQVNVFPVNG